MIDDFVSFVFAPLFFASIGLKVNFILHFDVKLVLVVLTLACVGKLFGAVLGARWGGFPTRERWAIGFAMNARGAMEIILGTLALQAGIIQQKLFVALVVMAMVTSALGGPLIRWVLRRPKPHRLLTFLSPKLFIAHLVADNRLDAIRELSAVAAQHSGVEAFAIEKLAWRREQLAATGIGNGVAIPHARLDEITEPVVVLGISEPGISFDAPDGQPAHVLFLLVTPRSDPAFQLELSADIAHLFRMPRCLERMLRASNYTEILAALKSGEARSS
jgi:mannitol/fructose-specific phosphotransferase system IIA component (Ntr-type)